MPIIDNLRGAKRTRPPIPKLLAPDLAEQLEKATGRLGELERQLDFAALAARSEGAAEAQKRELARLKAAVAAQLDDVAELERAHRAATEQDVDTKRQLQAQLTRVQKTALKRQLAEADLAASRLVKALADAVREYGNMIDAGHQIVEQALPEGVTLPDELLHAPGRFRTALTAELFRISGVPTTLPGATPDPPFPRCCMPVHGL